MPSPVPRDVGFGPGQRLLDVGSKPRTEQCAMQPREPAHGVYYWLAEGGGARIGIKSRGFFGRPRWQPLSAY